jgi:hypothetical protein
MSAAIFVVLSASFSLAFSFSQFYLAVKSLILKRHKQVLISRDGQKSAFFRNKNGGLLSKLGCIPAF